MSSSHNFCMARAHSIKHFRVSEEIEQASSCKTEDR